MKPRCLAGYVALVAVAAGLARADAPEHLRRHPAAETLELLFPDRPAAPALRPTGLSKKDYLPLIAGNVDFFRQHQDERGAIIDPYEKKERQYSTPAFALAAALLVAEMERADLLDPASRALSFSIAALVSRTTADNHADFYIPMVIHARRLLAARVRPEIAEAWTRELMSIVPEKTYSDTTPRGNWNVVNVAGELLRRRDGLVPPEQRAAHEAYVDRCLDAQRKHMTKFGMYEDPSAPLAYDAFPRLWLEDVLADGAYDGGAHHQRLEEFLTLGGLSTLLLLSPTGEWASGGRSAHHQWNEAQIAVISEINAGRWHRAGRDDVAGAFKRAARLALSSMRRWQRPSGEMWIVKNRADPARRHGYEGYSFHSQYNLLAMAMLAIAHQRADDAIDERPIPAEHGSYVFDLRDTFHKIAAAAGGTYVLIDTAADPRYNATGLQRIHRAGIPFSPLSDSAAADRGYGPGNERFKVAVSPAIGWKAVGANDWTSLSQFTLKRPSYSRVVRLTDLTLDQRTDEMVAFRLRYLLEGPDARLIEEHYRIDASGVEVRSHVGGDEDAPPAARVTFPILVSDGATGTDVKIDGSRVTVRHHGSRLTFEVLTPEPVKLRLMPPDVATHNGFVRMAAGELPPGSRQATWKITLSSDDPVRE